MMENAGFPSDKGAAVAAYNLILAEQRSRSGVAEQLGLKYDSVMGYLAKFHNVLPLSPELHHEERVEMIKSAFDKDKGGDIDETEFWNGLQVFTDPLKSSKKLRVPTRKEQSEHTTIASDVHRLDSKVDALTTELAEIKALLTDLVAKPR
jgi:hypothetical protein